MIWANHYVWLLKIMCKRWKASNLIYKPKLSFTLFYWYISSNIYYICHFITLSGESICSNNWKLTMFLTICVTRPVPLLCKTRSTSIVTKWIITFLNIYFLYKLVVIIIFMIHKFYYDHTIWVMKLFIPHL
jgi:hypothetical protein